MEWACRFHPVPRPLARGQDADGSWLVTAPVPGDSAVTARWKAEPAVAVTAIGAGLRAMHDSLPAAGCPFSWSAEERLAAARRKAEAGGQDPAAWHPSHQGLTVAAALESAAAIPPADQLVVCHGDACAEHPDRRRRSLVRACRPRQPRHRGPVGGPGDRDLERRVELRPWLGTAAARRLRRRAGSRTDQVLPPVVGPWLARE
jgi:Phosphotransferase enzyme family